jgi:hypothetical protein
MGKEGIKILNDVDYITISIMISIAGKSREYCAEHAGEPIDSAGKKGRRGLFPARNVLEQPGLVDSPVEAKASGIGNPVLSRWAIAINQLK